MSILERDIVLVGKGTDGQDGVEFPLARLGWMESDAEIKESITADDMIPVIDTENENKMKKVTISSILEFIRNSL